MPNPTIIIIPGSWHIPGHYKRLITALSAQNYRALAIPLPSVNSSPPLSTWEEDALAIRKEILNELDAGRDVIALAHSFGGVAMGEAVKGLGKGDRMRDGSGVQTGAIGLVYMCAMALLKGQSHVGQMVPVGAVEEEIEKERNEYGAKHGGVSMTEVCTTFYILLIYGIWLSWIRTARLFCLKMP